MDVGTILKFKQDHPGNYWVRLLALCFSMVFLLMWADQAGADIDIFDINDGIQDLEYGWGDDAFIGVCPSNRWYFPFINSDGDFNVSWTDNNGTSWSNVTVQSEGWKGETKMRVNSIQTWVNNTTVIILNTEGADNAYDGYLFWLWGENDPSDAASWNYTSIRGGGSKPDHFSMIFNRTGTLYIVYNYVNAIRTRLWEVSTGVLGSDTSWVGTNGYPAIQCDHNNVVWVAYQQSATTGTLYIWDYDRGVSLSTTDSSGRYKFGNFFIAADNTKVMTGYYLYLSTYGSVVWYESVVNTTITSNMFASGSDDWNTGYWTTGNIYGNTVSVINLRLETGSEEFVRYRAQYDAVDATWEGSETVLWTVPTDDDLCYHFASGPNSVWPKIEGVSVPRLLSGDIHYWNFKDEVGSPDDFYDIVYTDSPVFTWYDWSPPPGPDPDPDPGPGGTPGTNVSWALWWGEDGGTCVTTLVIGLIVLVILISMLMWARHN